MSTSAFPYWGNKNNSSHPVESADSSVAAAKQSYKQLIINSINSILKD